MAIRKNRNFKRSGTAKQIGELTNKVLDPALKKRGFANREMIAQWMVIVPPPYGKTTAPDRLKWQRGKPGAAGALLYLRCEEAMRLAVVHDQELIVGAVNRYFGYVLVEGIRLSAHPLVSTPVADVEKSNYPNKDQRGEIETAIANVNDDGMKQALRKLGFGVVSDKTTKR